MTAALSGSLALSPTVLVVQTDMGTGYEQSDERNEIISDVYAI